MIISISQNFKLSVIKFFLFMLLKIKSIIYSFYKKIKRKLLPALRNEPAGGLIIEFEFYDSDFKNISVDVYDLSSRKFVKCSFVPSARTFKWRRHGIYIDFKASAISIGADFIVKITRPAISGLQPFVMSGISLKVYGAAGFGDDAEVISRFDASTADFIKSGFFGPYIISSKTVFSLKDLPGNSPAYVIFGDIAEKLETAGFKFFSGAVAGDLKIIDLFTAGASDNIITIESQSAIKEAAVSEETAAPELNMVVETVEPEAAEEEIKPEEKKEVKQELEPEIKAGPELEIINEAGRPKIAVDKEKCEKKEPEEEKSDTEEITAKGSVKEENEYEEPEIEEQEEEKQEEERAEEELEKEGRAESLESPKPRQSHFLINFFSKESWAPRIKQLNPKFSKSVIAKADGILSGEYEINGFYYKLPDSIDWHNNFNYSKWPAAEGHKYFSSLFQQSVIDAPSKAEGIWPYSIQFAKNNEWVYLALAYKLSGDDKYANKIVDLFKEFKAQNDIGFGINFAFVSVCAERLVSWLMTFELVEDKFTDLFTALGFHDYFNRQFDYVYERVVSRPRESERHERAVALACLYGVLLQVGGRIAPALTKVYKKLKEEILYQTVSDGAHISSSPAFLFSIYKSMLYSLILSKKTSAARPSSSPDSAFKDAVFIDAFKRISLHLTAMAAPNGLLPNIADYYGCFFLPFDERSPLDLRPSLQSASYLLMDKNFKFLTAENKISEIVMLFGEDGAAEYNVMPVSVSEVFSSRLEDSGYFCVTTSCDPFGDNNAAARLIFNYGGKIQHNHDYKNFEFLVHNDLHNIIISHGGVDFIGDSGPALFIKNKEINFYKRNLSAHNGVVLNKTNFSSSRSDVYMPESFRHYEDGGACLVSSTHKGYQGVDIDALVRRTIVMINCDYLLIMDDIFNSRKKPVYFDIDLFFHSPPDITIESVSSSNNKNLLAYNSRSSEAKMINLNHCAQKISGAVYRASNNPAAGWYSNAAGQTNESSTVIQSVRFAKLPVRIYNLFYLVKADDNLNSITKKLRMNLNKISSSIEICHRDYKDSIKINDKFEVDFNRSAVKI